MLSKVLSTEIEYIKKFTENHEYEDIIRFYDNSLPGMYTHNFTFIKKDICENGFKKIVTEELENRKSQNADFLRIEFNFSINQDALKNLPLIPQVTKYDYMYIDTKMSDSLSGNKECVIKKALSSEVLKDGMEVDILANQSNMGNEFAKKRIYRKADVYRQPDSNLDLYVCYHNNTPIGNCEFMVNGNIAKIEDFDIVENWQRKGFGTSILKHLLNEGKEHNIEFAYLITDSEDTAKEMYKKCGFKKIGQKIELFFDLSSS